jgi:hypothetical protein
VHCARALSLSLSLSLSAHACALTLFANVVDDGVGGGDRDDSALALVLSLACHIAAQMATAH